MATPNAAALAHPPDSRRRVLGIAAGVGAAAIWGGMYVVSKYVLDVVPPLTLVVLRLAIGTATLAIIIAVTRQPRVKRADLTLMILLGFIGLCVSMVAQFAGTRLSTAANGSLITSATPAFMILFARPILGERLTVGRVASLVLASIGVAVTVFLEPAALGEVAGPRSSIGDVLLFVAAVTWALYSTLGRIAAARYPVVVTTAYATFFGGIFTGLLVPFELANTSIGPISPVVIAGILYLGVVSTAVAFYLWNASIALLGAGLPAILFFAQPIVGGVLGALLLGEQLTLPFWIGGTLIGTAAVVAARDG